MIKPKINAENLIKTILFFVTLFPFYSNSQTIKNCPPTEYPKMSIKLNEQGVAVVGVSIDSFGKVISSVILKSSGHERLDKQSLSTIEKCIFNPKLIENKAVEGRFRQNYIYDLTNTEDKRNANEYIEISNPEAEKILDASIKKLKEERELREKSESEAKDKEEKHQAWLLTAEGKKFLADEALKIQKIENEVHAKQKIENELLEKRKIEQKEKIARVNQQCEGMKNWATNSEEIIAVSLKTSISKISLIRFKLEKNECVAIIDTPEGPRKCTVIEILKDKKTGKYFAYMAVINVPLCRGLYEFN